MEGTVGRCVDWYGGGVRLVLWKEEYNGWVGGLLQ